MVPVSRRRQPTVAVAADTQFTLRARPLAGNWRHEGNKRASSHLSQSRVEPSQHGGLQAKRNGDDEETNQNRDDDDELRTAQRETASATSFAYLKQQQQQQKPRRTPKCQSNAANQADCCQAAAAYCCCCCAPASKSTCAVPAAAAVAARQPASKMIRSTIKSAPATKCISATRTRVDQNANSTSSTRNKEISEETMTKTKRRVASPAPEVCDELSRQQQRTRRRYGTATAVTTTSCSDFNLRLEAGTRLAAEMSPPPTSEDDDNIGEETRTKLPAATANRWSRHSAGGTSPSLSWASSPSLNSLSSLNSLELGTSLSRPRHQRTVGATTSAAGKFSQLTSGAGSASVSLISSGTRKRRPAPLPPKTGPARRSQSATDVRKQQTRDETPAASELLSEQEVHAIEHFLRSHKSSVYVCGCMANLYFTKTHLADNGRSSRAASGEWKLNKTGVPVLIFDSGLAKNRQKKRLSISLTERGSGFVLWSDTIDHLSNYRAFSPSLHSIEGGGVGGAGSGGQQEQQQHADTCDSFHVMYLSSNHRIMVGLSFDNPLCARLFLAQIELVCSDPANIALTGPKNNLLASAASVKNPPTGGKLTQSLSSGALPTSTRRGFTGKLNLFGRVGPAKTSQANQSITSAGWSTLKRAARLGGRGATGSQLAVPLVGKRTDPLVTATSEHDRGLLETFKPRPLAQLAAEGKVWSRTTRDQRASGHRKLGRAQLKKIPRKCDISAPCLFQHVTSVDQTHLDQLYSKSFVLERQLERTSSGAATSGRPAPLAAEPVVEPQPEVISRTSCAESVPQCAEQEVASGLREGTPKKPTNGLRTTTCHHHHHHQEQVVATTKSSSLSGSSSSSCYSSGSSSSASSVAISCAPSHSHSPASSDSDRDRLSATEFAGQQLKWRTHLSGARLGLRVARPPVAPPEPPQREPAPSQSTFGKPRPPPTSGRTKINSILRELQSHVSSDLVDAKRRLMADIANRAGGGGGGGAGIGPAPGPGARDHQRSTAKTSISRL